jgi:hypothetical protein
VARKKKSEEKTAPIAETPQPPPLDDEVKVLSLSEVQLLKMLRAEAELRAATAELQLAQVLLEQTVKTVDPEGKIAAQANRLRAAGSAVATARKLHEDTGANVGKELGVDLKKCSFDDVTGAIHVAL